MKKIIAMLLAMMLVVSLVGCADTTAEESSVAEESSTVEEASTESSEAEESSEEATEESSEAETEEVAVMTYEEYAAAELDSEVTIEAYVQATQSWWFDDSVGYGKITVYAQDQDGAYFIYELKCDEADAPKFVEGTKIRVTGYKAEWSGEIEIVDGTFEFVEDADTFVAEPMDATSLLGTEELIDHQNKLVSFKGLTVKSISYKNDEPGDDIYVTVSLNDADYDFCVEAYLTDAETDVYKAVGELQEGDVIDVEGFLYWYEGVNTHITAVAAAK